MGCFNERKSDIDLLVKESLPLPPQNNPLARKIHLLPLRGLQMGKASLNLGIIKTEIKELCDHEK